MTVSNNDNNDNFNNEDDEFGSNPFGLDPEAISGMLNEIMSSGTLNFASGLGGMFNPLSDGPMGIAKRVAADIASRDIDENQISDSEEIHPSNSQDPMAEIMGIISMLSSPPQNTLALSVDKVFQDRCEQIYPAAQNYVASQANADSISVIPLVVTDRVSWTKDYIASMQGPLEVASKSLSPTFGEAPETQDPNQPTGLDIQSMISKTIAPMMFGVQAGTMLGYLSHRAYGDDDVLLPAKLPFRVGLIASGVQKFCDDWSVPTDEGILYFLILQTLRAHIRSGSWLTEKLDNLCTQYVAAYELNPYKLEELMGEMDIENPESITAINVSPEQMFETLRTPKHDILDEEIGRISSLHDAYVEWVMHKDIEKLLPNYRIIQEARKRITVTTSDADKFVEQLFGVATSRNTQEEAAIFIDGVLQREGESKLHQIWKNEELIPTQAEFGAPGLWLARLDVM